MHVDVRMILETRTGLEGIKTAKVANCYKAPLTILQLKTPVVIRAVPHFFLFFF